MKIALKRKAHQISRIYYDAIQNDQYIINFLKVLFFILLYSVFEFASFLSLAIFFISTHTLLSREWTYRKQKGLIFYLPNWVQTALTRSSLLDIFTSLWSPNTLLYLKAFVQPFFHNISPEEAIQTLDDLPSEMKTAILTKGIVYSLPRLFKKILLPEQIYHELCKNEDAEMAAIEQENKHAKEENEKWGVDERKTERKRELPRVIEEEELLQVVGEKESELERFGRKSTLMNLHSSFLMATLEGGNGAYHNNNAHNSSLLYKVVKPIEEKQSTFESFEGEIPTKIIASSSDISQPFRREKLNSQDSVHFLFENLKNTLNGASSDSILGQLKNAMNLLSGVAEIKNNTELLTKIETTKVYKWFMFSALFLLSQYFISRKTRRWLISSSMFAAYICSFFLTFGSLGVFIYKQVNNQNQKGLNQNSMFRLPPSVESSLSRTGKSKRRPQNKHEDNKFLIDDMHQK